MDTVGIGSLLFVVLQPSIFIVHFYFWVCLPERAKKALQPEHLTEQRNLKSIHSFCKNVDKFCTSGAG